jgi:hypothetical protein
VPIADLSREQFPVTSHPRDVPQLLDQLGLSSQKAKVRAAGADAAAALRWLEATGLEMVQVAREKRALVLFGDEASFAQGGRWARPGRSKAASRSPKRGGFAKPTASLAHSIALEDASTPLVWPRGRSLREPPRRFWSGSSRR